MKKLMFVILFNLIISVCSAGEYSISVRFSNVIISSSKTPIYKPIVTPVVCTQPAVVYTPVVTSVIYSQPAIVYQPIVTPVIYSQPSVVYYSQSVFPVRTYSPVVIYQKQVYDTHMLYKNDHRQIFSSSRFNRDFHRR